MGDMSLDFSSLDDSMGESLGSGFDSSALDLSGSDAFSLDFLGEEPLQGSDLALGSTDGFVSTAGVSDLSSLEDNFFHDSSLSGVSDPPVSSISEFPWSLNGSGTAASSTKTISSDVSGISNLFAGLTKFGASIGSMVSGGSSQRAAVGSPMPGVNPNKLSATSISGSHATLLIVVVLVLAGAVVMGGRRNAQ
jgi:hypothetical protein